MPREDLSLREAGGAISNAGLADDVIQADERQITNRRGRQREDADDADTREAPKKKARKPVEEDDTDDYADDDADSSNRDAGEHEEGDEDDREDDDAGDDAGDADADAEGDDADAEEELHTVKVAGKEFKVPTKELIAGYQRNEDYHRKTQGLAEKQRTLMGSHAKVAETYARQLAQAGGVVSRVRALLIGDVDSAEMQQLRHKNPTEWMVQRQVMQDRIAAVDHVLSSLNQEHERHVGEYTKQQKEHRKAIVAHEHELVAKDIPDWHTGEGKARLGKYLNQIGFRDEELVDVIDNRMLRVAEKARLWDEYQANRKKPTKRVAKPLPKSLKPGQGQLKRNGGGKPAQQRRDFETAAAKARRTGDTRDAGKAISKLL